MDEDKQPNPPSDEDAEPVFHILFPDVNVDAVLRQRSPSGQRILKLCFADDKGLLRFSQVVLNNLVELVVVEVDGLHHRLLGHMQLEGYPCEPVEEKKTSPLSLNARAKQLAVSLIVTQEMVSAPDIIDGVPGIQRAEAVKALTQLAKEGRLVRVAHGIYGHPDRPKPDPSDIEKKRGRKGRATKKD